MIGLSRAAEEEELASLPLHEIPPPLLLNLHEFNYMIMMMTGIV